MQPNPDRQALIEQMSQRFKKKLEAQMPDDNATLDQIEDAVDKIGQDIRGDLQERWTHQRAKKPRDNRIDCPCGGRARYRNMDPKTLITRHGLLAWKRAYYYCDTCKRGLAPLVYIGAGGVMTPLGAAWKKDGSLGDLSCH